MIYIFHGDDTLSSYKRIKLVTSEYVNFQVNHFSEKDTKEEFSQVLLAQDLLEINKIFILENFISKKKITPKELKNIRSDIPVLFWEKTKLVTSKFINNNVNIMEFKINSNIYKFLDSIVPNSKNTFLQLNRLGVLGETGLIWQISNRLYMLLVNKLHISRIDTEKIVSRHLADWQWSRLSQQAGKFDIKTLSALFAGMLKIDYLIKSGKTDVLPKVLISILFVKYLKP